MSYFDRQTTAVLYRRGARLDRRIDRRALVGLPSPRLIRREDRTINALFRRGVPVPRGWLQDDATGFSGLGGSGAAGGAVTGAVSGAAAGTMVFPVIGTAVGAVVGAAGGYFAGRAGEQAGADAQKAAEKVALTSLHAVQIQRNSAQAIERAKTQRTWIYVGAGVAAVGVLALTIALTTKKRRK